MMRISDMKISHKIMLVMGGCALSITLIAFLAVYIMITLNTVSLLGSAERGYALASLEAHKSFLRYRIQPTDENMQQFNTHIDKVVSYAKFFGDLRDRLPRESQADLGREADRVYDEFINETEGYRVVNRTQILLWAGFPIADKLIDTAKDAGIKGALLKEKLHAAVKMKTGLEQEQLAEVDKLFSDLLERGSHFSSLIFELTRFIQSGAQAVFCLFALLAGLAVGFLGVTLVKLVSLPVMSAAANLELVAHEVNSTGQNLVSMSERLNSASSTGAASLEETVSTVNSFSAALKQSLALVNKVSEASSSARSRAENAEQEMLSLARAIQEIVGGSTEAKNIISIIEGIAFQTNLLALNAAVEAARAGEQGKGFAVVAEAVRNLAQKAAQSAKDVNALVSLNEQRSQEGAKSLGKTAESLQEIVGDARAVDSFIRELSTVVSEQKESIEEIAKALAHIETGIHANAVTSNDAVDVADRLANKISVLEENVDVLRALVRGKGA